MPFPQNASDERAPLSQPQTQLPRVRFREGWVASQVNFARDLADRIDVTAEIERLAFEGLTELELITQLGAQLDPVKRTAELNGDSPDFAIREFVRFVRASLGIPFRDEQDEFDAWQKDVVARRRAIASSEPK